MKQRVRYIVAIALLLLAAFFGYQLLRYWQENRGAAEEFALLSDKFYGVVNTLEQVEQPTEVGEDSQLNLVEALRVLQAENSDTYGWLCVPGTKIDYPVMYTPAESEYYLRRNFQKEASTSGTPFMDASCTALSDNYILYGHNMKSGIMFADLLRYTDETFFQENNRIVLTLADGVHEYEVVAAFRSEVEETKNDFAWYEYITFTEEQVLQEYLLQLRAKSLHNMPVEPTFGDRFITLATCSYHDSSGRFVLVGREIGLAASSDVDEERSEAEGPVGAEE